MTFTRSVKTAMGRFMNEHIKNAKDLRTDMIVYVLFNLLAITMFLYGVVVMIPLVMVESSTFVYFVANTGAFFVLCGVLTNLQLIRVHHSSIMNRLLIRPADDMAEIERITQGSGDGTGISSKGSEDGYRTTANSIERTKNEIKYLAEHFVRTPFNSETAWHICAVCETFVPPRTWHCDLCKTCILRRDHHCIFAMRCIGEDNQAHFLGFLFYLALGSLYSTILSYIYVVQMQGTALWWWLFKSLMVLYCFLFDFSLFNMLASLSFCGCLAGCCVLGYYLNLALKGETSADSSRRISRKLPGKARYSYQNLEDFIGPNPILRILWPFIKPAYKSYDSTKKKDTGTSKNL